MSLNGSGHKVVSMQTCIILHLFVFILKTANHAKLGDKCRASGVKIAKLFIFVSIKLFPQHYHHWVFMYRKEQKHHWLLILENIERIYQKLHSNLLVKDEAHIHSKWSYSKWTFLFNMPSKTNPVYLWSLIPGTNLNLLHVWAFGSYLCLFFCGKMRDVW